MAKEEQGAADTSEDGGSNPKKFIIIGAAVAVVIILVAAVFMMTGKGGKKEAGDAKAEVHGEAKAETKSEGGAAASSKEGVAGAPNMYPLEPFIVNIYDGQELRYLKVKVEVEMVSPSVKLELDPRLPPIRDAILVLLSTKTLQDVQEIAGKIQLKDEILAAINKHIPPGKISKVYFTDFVVQ